MSKDKEFTGNVKLQETKYGTIIKLSWKAEELRDQLDKFTNENGYFAIDIMDARSGGKYAVVNMYKVDTNSKAKVAYPKEVEEDF